MTPTPCQHPEEAREVVMLPNDETPTEPIIMAGVRYCTVCYTLIVHLGESVFWVAYVAADDLTTAEFCDRCDGTTGVESEPIESTYSKLCAKCRGEQ